MKPKPIIRVSLNLFEGDREILQRFYPKMKWSVALRQLVHNHCKKLENKESKELRYVGPDPGDVSVEP